MLGQPHGAAPFSPTYPLPYPPSKHLPTQIGEDIAKETAKEWKGLRVTCKLTVQNRQAKVTVIPSAAALVIKALKEPVRDRKKASAGVLLLACLLACLLSSAGSWAAGRAGGTGLGCAVAWVPGLGAWRGVACREARALHAPLWQLPRWRQRPRQPGAAGAALEAGSTAQQLGLQRRADAAGGGPGGRHGTAGLEQQRCWVHVGSQEQGNAAAARQLHGQ